ncbi:cyclo(L-tyrosyl-L-tyrosyl) synthase [Kitasatospora sp. MAA4]|uniref:tRNA-dependent cyclodipeptide synthase n=1 Tax=Kitasatospora sp. MAA4 TaxID=3035093 RepID=UPI0024765B6B|nr:tRNA-dependent cyclodipeptide synthase [Kitasatospora sp. MAA4]MDH6133466.1 cyclo(L-tyrosyl-L-tyrosyl) synthase [Kitasatospora sp. MAA4]
MSDSLISTKPSTFEARPFSDRCRQVWERGDHLLIGVSPGNSYFSPQRISELILWAREFFDSVDIVYADLHVDTQFAAFGYTPEHAQRRAAKEIKTTARRIQRGVEEAGWEAVRVRAVSDFLADARYDQLRFAIEEGLRGDPVFRQAAEGMARSFLAGRTPDGAEPTAEQLAAGLRYICAELPFFLDTPGLLGVPTSVSCYHVELPLTPVLFGRSEGLRAVPQQAYAVVRPGVASAPRAAAA